MKELSFSELVLKHKELVSDVLQASKEYIENPAHYFLCNSSQEFTDIWHDYKKRDLIYLLIKAFIKENNLSYLLYKENSNCLLYIYAAALTHLKYKLEVANFTPYTHIYSATLNGVDIGTYYIKRYFIGVEREYIILRRYYRLLFLKALQDALNGIPK